MPRASTRSRGLLVLLGPAVLCLLGVYRSLWAPRGRTDERYSAPSATARVAEAELTRAEIVAYVRWAKTFPQYTDEELAQWLAEAKAILESQPTTYPKVPSEQETKCESSR